MNKRRRIALLVAALFVFAALVVLVVKPNEPAYLGKPLSAWLADLDGSGSARDSQAKEAVREIGTNALPQLMRMLSAGDSGPRRIFRELGLRHRFFRFDSTPASELNRRAAAGLEALGPEARPAIPEIIGLLQTEHFQSAASQVLLWIGPEAVPALTRALSNRDLQTRRGAALTLMQFGTNAVASIPALIESLKDESGMVRSAAAQALGEIGQEPNRVVPALIGVLNQTNAHRSLLAQAALSLGKFQSQARTAVPHLEKLLQHPESRVRRAATSALEQIDPAAAAKAR